MNDTFKTKVAKLRDGELPINYKKNRGGLHPTDWRVCELNDVILRVRNPVDVLLTDKYKQIGIRSHGKGIFYKEAVTGEDLGNKSVYWVEPGCFIVNIVFAWEMAVGKTTENEIGMIASHRFPMYKPKNNMINIDYLTYYFKSQRGKYLLELASPGGAGRNKTLGQTEFLELEVPLPPIEEQFEIARILSVYEKAIDLKEKLIEEKKRQKQIMMQKLLSGKVRLPGFFEEWNNVKLNRILGQRKEKSEVSQELELHSLTIEEGVTPKTERYDREFLVKSDNKKYKISKHNDIVYNPANLRFGAIAVNKIIKPVLLSPIYEVLHLKNDKLYSIDFIGHLLAWNRSICLFATMAEGTLIERMAVKIDTFLNVEFSIPPSVEEQKSIAVILDLADKELSYLKKELKALKQQRKGLMQLLLNGIVRVNVETN